MEDPGYERKGGGNWLHTVVILLILCAAGVLIWRIATARQAKEKQAAAHATAMALYAKVPVEGARVESKDVPVYLDGGIR